MRILKITLIIILASTLSYLYANETKKNAQKPAEKISVTISTPSSGYAIKIKSVHITPKETFVLTQIQPPDPNTMVMTVIQKATDTIKIEKISGKIRIFVTGKDWEWANKEDYTFIDNEQEFYKEIADATKVEILE